MAGCYSGAVPRLKPLPAIWLISDARNDAALEAALRRLPRGSGLVFRHYHLGEAARRARFDALARLARARGHVVALAGSRAQARRWGADKAYGAGGHLVPVHDLREIGRAARAEALLLSPVFPTRTHPGAKALGPLRFRLLAARARVPVIALGGMNRRSAKRLKWPLWAGIDAFLR
ncbi:MAG: thiamine phosphate synthase [Sphingomonadales bacterium]|nr:thiamine phosphate synthase [Sphingomonadaceae bacterium]MBS3930371.1 thiamine phosphate synthase [Sphingomonadales bacterium]